MKPIATLRASVEVALFEPLACETPFELKREIFLESQLKPTQNSRFKSSSSLIRARSNRKEPVTEKRALS